MKNDIPLQSPDFSKHSHGVAANDAGGIAMDIHQDIRRYIIDDLLLGTVDRVDDRESLSQSGILDSTGALELVAFLEERFAIAIDDHDLTPENLDTIDGIVALVGRKRALSQADSAVVGE